MEKGKRTENNEKSKWKFIRNIVITLIALAIVAGIFVIAPDYILPTKIDGVTLIINNRDVTSSERLKNELIIEDDVIYLSKPDIMNFFDKYLYYDSEYNQYITTSNDKVATIKVGESKITTNGITSEIKGKIIQKGDTIYLPISDMTEVYNIEVKNIKSTNIVLIDSLDREQAQVEVAKNINVKVKAKDLSRTIEKVEENSKLIWISENKGWVRVRTENGRIGYVKSSDLENKTYIRQAQKEENPIQKVSLVWDYYSEYAQVPNRAGTTVEGINVISPSFFVLKKLGKGEIIDKAETGGAQYVKWAKQNGYEVWPMVANDAMIETTSEILNDYKLRKKVIDSIVNFVKKYDLDGINIDFENMYKDDKNAFSRFIIELYPRLKECNAKLSVDVTAPDGGDTWSLCFDRNVIADNSDYIVFMAYDQYTDSSKKAGTTAGYNWVKNNVDKFLGQEGIEKEKLILGIPFYTRLWTENSDGKLKSVPVNMKDLNTAIPRDVERKWDDVLKQYYAEYEENNQIKKIWIEDINSIKEKLKLAKDYDLAGVSFWSLGRQDDSVWKEVNNIILNK